MTVHSLYGVKLGYDQANKAARSLGFSAVGSEGYDYAYRGIVLPSPTVVAVYDDFLGDVVADQWNFTEGTDSTTSDGAIVAAVNGTFVLTPGDSAGTVAADGSQLNAELNWQGQQDLWFATRVKLASIASVSCFIGFTDTKSLEQPVQSASSADTVTTNATDAVGFMFDTNQATDNWFAVGVANDVDATVQNLGVAPVAATYEDLAIQLRKQSGNTVNATFFRNGLKIGNVMTSAVTYNVSLTPCFIVRPLSAAAGKTLTIDYVNIAGNRV